METIVELVARARAAGVALYLNGGKLAYVAGGGKLSPELRQAIGERRDELVVWLQPASLQPPTAVSPLPQVDRRQPQPLSFAQQRLWFIHQLGGSAQYHMAGAVRVRGDFDEALAEQALHRLVQRHEPLRTVFVDTEQGPRQCVGDDFAFTLERGDLCELAPAARDAAVQQARLAHAAAPFDLKQDLMLRAAFLRLDADGGVLLFNLHHIAADAWSMGLLLQEFAQVYDALRRQQPYPLLPLEVHYAQFAALERRQWHDGSLDAQLRYWERQLRDLPATHALPLDRPRPAQQSFAAAVRDIALGRADLDALKRSAAAANASLFMLLHAAFALVLARYCGSDDIVIGTPVTTRPRRELEPLVGLFVNTLVLRTDCSGQCRWSEFLDHVRSVNLDALAHRELPFEALVERLNPPRTASHPPLFQILLNLVRSDAQPAAVPALAMDWLPAAVPTEKFDLSLEASERQGQLALRLSYSTHLFDAATMDRFADYLEQVLARIAAGEQELDQLLRPVDDAPTLQAAALLPAQRRAQCLHSAFEAQVRRTPDGAAVVLDGRTLSYAELDARALRLARRLRGCGAGPEQRVGLLAERSLSLVVGVLAVLKAGAAYVPLDPDYPPERLAWLVADSAPAALLVQPHLAARLPPSAVATLPLHETEDADDPADDVVDAADCDGGCLAYVIYTSGSTGQPKGVMNEHGAVLNGLLWARDAFPLGVGDRVLHKTPISFDVSVWELLLPLITGATVVLARPGGQRDPAYLAQLIRSEAIDTAFFVPSLLRSFLDTAPLPQPSLRRIVCSGEALPDALYRRCAEQFSDVSLYNLYGPTEAAVHATAWCNRSAAPGDSVCIGRPLPGTAVRILDGRGLALPAGAVGEIVLGGIGVARGYHGRADLTSQRFIDDPAAPDGYRRWYRTGDRGRWRADGNLDYLGRADDQVKLRGFRIEPGEIEHQLQTVAGVVAALVLLREDVPGDQRLVAYVAVGGEAGDSVHDPALVELLRRRVQEQLPDYLRPSAFVLLPQFPLTASGKTDRRALPPPQADFGSAAEFQAPSSAPEIALAGLWAALLRVDARRIGRQTNFFALGGHSLLAVQLVTRIREQFGAAVALRDVFDDADLAALARRIVAAAPATLERIAVADRTAPLPLSYSQQRLWAVDQMGGSAQYHLPVALRVDGMLDAAALQWAVEQVVARHEVLRTTLVVDNGVTVQKIAAAAVALTEVDLSALDEEAQRLAVKQQVQHEAQQPFRLDRDPPLRLSLLRLSMQSQVVLFTMHHIAADGWSFGVLVRELNALYSERVSGAAAPLPPLPVQYADFAQWQRSWLQSDAARAAQDYWREQLADCPLLHDLPLDRPRPPRQGVEGRCLEQQLDGELATALEALSRREGATLFMLLQTAFALLVSRYSQKHDVVIGTPVAGRTRAELEPLIGFFINYLPLRSRFEENLPLTTVLAQQKQMLLDAYSQQELPFQQMVEALNPPRSVAYDPIIQLVFGLEMTGVDQLELGELQLSVLRQGQPPAKVDLEVTVNSGTDGMALSWLYRSELFDESTIAGFAVAYERLLRGIVQRPHCGIFDFVLDEADGGQGGDLHEAEQVCVHSAFEAQVRRTPDALAAACGEQVLSYRELDERAARLARYLLDSGIGSEARIGLHLPRSLELLIGVLGVLKAGATYVPLEPELPAQRIAYLLSDANIVSVLSSSAGVDALPLQGIDVLLMDGAASDASWLQECAAGELPVVNPDQLAYVLYTSGSTGQPKGVMVPHRAVANYLDFAVREYLGEGITGAVVSSPLCFDATLTTLLPPLLCGKPVVLLPDDETMLQQLASRLFASETEWLFKITPAHLEALAYLERPVGMGLAAHCIVVGGEQFAASTLRQWKQTLLPNASFVNEYGPTETVVGCSIFRVDDADTLATVQGAATPIGKPIANTQLYVLGEELQRQPVGAVGELYIGGAGVTAGYLNRPELTAERFVRNPFSLDPRSRLYRSGDRVRRLADGNLMFLGRNDDQVKIRGFRIELGEIEHHLRALDGVREAAVLVRGDADTHRQLVAYVVPADSTDADDAHPAVDAARIARYRAALAERLPAHSLPHHWLLLAALPLTANGKVDRRALALRRETAAVPMTAAALTPLEQLLCEVWSDILGGEPVHPDDNFFALGGDSILCIRIVARLKQCGLDISVADIFQCASVAALHRRLLAQGGMSGDLVSGEFPATPASDKAAERAPQG